MDAIANPSAAPKYPSVPTTLKVFEMAPSAVLLEPVLASTGTKSSKIAHSVIQVEEEEDAEPQLIPSPFPQVLR